MNLMRYRYAIDFRPNDLPPDLQFKILQHQKLLQDGCLTQRSQYGNQILDLTKSVHVSLNTIKLRTIKLRPDQSVKVRMRFLEELETPDPAIIKLESLESQDATSGVHSGEACLSPDPVLEEKSVPNLAFERVTNRMQRQDSKRFFREADDSTDDNQENHRQIRADLRESRSRLSNRRQKRPTGRLFMHAFKAALSQSPSPTRTVMKAAPKDAGSRHKKRYNPLLTDTSILVNTAVELNNCDINASVTELPESETFEKENAVVAKEADPVEADFTIAKKNVVKLNCSRSCNLRSMQQTADRINQTLVSILQMYEASREPPSSD